MDLPARSFLLSIQSSTCKNCWQHLCKLRVCACKMDVDYERIMCLSIRCRVHKATCSWLMQNPANQQQAIEQCSVATAKHLIYSRQLHQSKVSKTCIRVLVRRKRQKVREMKKFVNKIPDVCQLVRLWQLRLLMQRWWYHKQLCYQQPPQLPSSRIHSSSPEAASKLHLKDGDIFSPDFKATDIYWRYLWQHRIWTEYTVLTFWFNGCTMVHSREMPMLQEFAETLYDKGVNVLVNVSRIHRWR